MLTFKVKSRAAQTLHSNSASSLIKVLSCFTESVPSDVTTLLHCFLVVTLLTSFLIFTCRFKILSEGIQMWPVKMTGEVKKWPVKRHFWPVIVRWPAVILSPESYITFFDKSLCTCDVETLIICISNKLKYVKNDAKKQKSEKCYSIVFSIFSNKTIKIFISYTL